MKYIAETLCFLVVFIAGCAPRTALIGVSPCGNREEYRIGSPMFTSVFKAGGVPVMLPMVQSESEAESLIDNLDGLIMVGGEDVNPSYYGEEMLNQTVHVNSFRDTSDFLLLKAAMNKHIPILGICRGEQIINVFLGGSLYQDIPSQIGEHLPSGTHEHWIRIEKDTRLYEILSVDSILVNSFHHQAVKTLGNGLKVSARAFDNVIEAYEGDNIFAVQFHPESFISCGDDRFLPIFQNFIECTLSHEAIF